MDAMVRWKFAAAVALPALVCHWLCQCLRRGCDHTHRTGGASGTRPLLLLVLLLPAMLSNAAIAVAAPDGAASNGASRDGSVQQATYRSAADAAHASASAHKLNEPMPIGPAGRESDDPASAHGGHHDAPAATSSVPAVLSMFGSLAVVIGLFLGLVWLLRRGSPKAARLLSSDVVELLGRSPLAGRQQMNVIRFGNRLLLVAVSPDGAKTLAEVTDPLEVDRLAGLCQQTQTNSATQVFRQVFGQLADIRRPGQLGANAAPAAAAPAVGSRDSVPSRHAEDDDV
jgi:flagellar biogenesis protein FliO